MMELLMTVKAYPEVSKTLGEVVCVAGTSLGAFRPAEVLDLEISEANEWTQAQRNSLNRLNLLADDREQLEWIPYRFRHVYRCGFERCHGNHRQSIIDWEIKQAYRRWSREYPDDWAERIRSKWLDELCAPDRDTVFFVGNQFGAPKAFLVLGVYWPPRQPARQLGLPEV